mmetsp:Transcript_19416/g.29100  ORF Transcript_19416/g.29100 Transcript_19416/m.29100 type:complete len:81 (-) Transcript_19416:639-881(-)
MTRFPSGEEDHINTFDIGEKREDLPPLAVRTILRQNSHHHKEVIIYDSPYPARKRKKKRPRPPKMIPFFCPEVIELPPNP